MKGIYNPDHPLEPSPPTLLNRILCRMRSHFWTLSTFHHYELVATFICLGCSKVMTVSLPTGRITEPPINPVITQH